MGSEMCIRDSLNFDPRLAFVLATRVELAWTSWGGLGGTLPFDLGGSTHRVLRPSVSVARCLSASPVAHRCRRLNSAIRRPSFAPLMILGMLLLWCPLSNRAVFHSGSSDVLRGHLGGGLGGTLPFDLGGGTLVSCLSVSVV